jgi:hypothetical protein
MPSCFRDKPRGGWTSLSLILYLNINCHGLTIRISYHERHPQPILIPYLHYTTASVYPHYHDVSTSTVS